MIRAHSLLVREESFHVATVAVHQDSMKPLVVILMTNQLLSRKKTKQHQTQM